MKRALFCMTIGLLILPLASCTLSLSGTPIPSPTPLAATPTPFSVPTETVHPTETPTLAPTPTPESLGGAEVAYLWDSHNHLLPSLPEGVTNILKNPSTPDVWKQPTGLFYSDGTPLLWGDFFVDTYGPTRVNFPVLVRDVVEIPKPSSTTGETVILPIFEAPAGGGSNFIISYGTDKKIPTIGSVNISYLTNGIPPTWESSLDHPVDSEIFYAGMKFTGVYNNRKIADVLKQYVGRVIIVTFGISDNSPSDASLKQVVQGELINQGSHSVDDTNILEGLILPPK